MKRFVRIGSVIVNVDEVEALQRFSEGAVTVHLASGKNIAGVAQCNDEVFELMRHQLAGDVGVESDAHISVRIILNGRERWVKDGLLSFEEICKLAGVSEWATVVCHAPGVGHSLMKGQSVRAQHGMIIDAIVTGNA